MQANEQIIDVLEYLCKKIGVTIDFTNKNILPYVNQLCEKYINWEITTSISWIVIAAIVGIGAFFLCKSIYQSAKKKEEEGKFGIARDYYSYIKSIIVLAVLLISLIVISQTFDIIECLTFPEKAIYEYIVLLMEAN